jgi:antitoxin component YwqK of YwqJK toxin-antitoxin module/peroxiredoxin
MKNTLLFLISILFTISLSAQTEHKEYYDNGDLKEVGQYNSEGKGTGEWKFYDENGKLKSIGKYKDGKAVGEWLTYIDGVKKWSSNYTTKLRKEFYESGKLKSIEDKSYNKEDDNPIKEYFESGQLKHHSQWVEETIIDKTYNEYGEITYWNSTHYTKSRATQSFFNPNGDLIAKWIFKITNGKEELIEKTKYYATGELKETGKYVNIGSEDPNNTRGYPYTTKNGEWKGYYKSGELQYKKQYNSYENPGKYEVFFKNGKLYSIGEFLNKSSTYYDDLVKFGKWKEYYSNGNLKSISTYILNENKDSRQVTVNSNEFISYHENGQLFESLILKKGQFSEVVSQFNNKGESLKKGTLINGNGTYYSYNPEGILLEIWTFKEGNLIDKKINLEGQSLPKIDLKTIDGKTINTKNLNKSGKPYVLLFWAEWCGPCNGQLKSYSKEYSDFKKETGVDIYVVSTFKKGKNNLTKIKDFIQKDNMPFDFYIDEDSKLAKELNLTQIPVLFLIGENGELLHKDISWYSSSQTISQLDKIKEVIQK